MIKKISTNEIYQSNSVVDLLKHESDNRTNLTETRGFFKQFKIKPGTQAHLRALPPQSKGFYSVFCLCLFNIFKQPQLIYFLISLILKFFQFCDRSINTTIIYFIMIIILVLMELIVRYITYTVYVSTDRVFQNDWFEIWQVQKQSWKRIPYRQIKAGQIIKVQNSVDNDNVNNPVNILPISVQSHKNSLLIKTTNLDKSQQFKYIPVIESFKSLVNANHTKFEQQLFKCSIQYHFVNQSGQNFEAKLKVFRKGEDLPNQYNINNQCIIPRGIPIYKQAYVIGIVLFNLSSLDVKQSNIKNVMNAKNKVNVILGQSIIPIVIFIVMQVLLCEIVQLVVSLIMTQYINLIDSIPLDILCNIVNLAGIFSNTIYIVMYIFLIFHRLMDARILLTKNNIEIKNKIKSIDQFGQINTIIMDDYFFIGKDLFDECKIIVNNDVPFENDLSILLAILQSSNLVKSQMYDHWISITKYYRRRFQNKNNFVTIIKEKFVSQISIKIDVIIVYHQYRGSSLSGKRDYIQKKKQYSFKVTQKPMFSSIAKIKNEQKKKRIQNQMKAFPADNNLLLMIQIQKQSLDISASDYVFKSHEKSDKYQFHTLIKFQINIKKNFPLTLIKNSQIKNKNSLIIMTSKKWKYFQPLLSKTQLKKNTDIIIMLQQKQSQQLKSTIKNHLRKLKQLQTLTLKQRQRSERNNDFINTSFVQKNAIVCIEASMIAHLSRDEIINSIKKLSKYSKYIIFYNCSQYQKQLCALSLFNIFPFHIYLSNYICDSNIMRKSNLSVCQKGASSQPFTTVVVNSYKDLRHLIVNQAINSIHITTYIIKSHIFKNQMFIVSMLLTQFLIYQSRYFAPGIEFSQVIFVFYNLVFTGLPIMYYIIFRPQIWVNRNVDHMYLRKSRIFNQFVKASVFGILLSLLSYSFLLYDSIQNIFFSILTNCIYTSLLYYLYIDDSHSKVIQIVVIIIQYVISLLTVYLVTWLNAQGFQFVIIQSNLTSKGTIKFFISALIVVPIVATAMLYCFSAGRARLQQIKHQHDDSQIQGIQLTESYTQVALKIKKDGPGKQMHFRQF